MKNIEVVIGANFGDEGKGQVTDYIANTYQDSKIVVLHNGGSQRAHTVQVTKNGPRHIFRHVGSGTLAGAATFIAKDFIINPIIFLQEIENLKKVGIVDANRPRIFIDGRCRFTTPYDMIVNQAREIDRGTMKHGSCGLGIFETVARYNYGDVKIKEQIIAPFCLSIGTFKHLSKIDKIDFLHALKNFYTDKRINNTKIANFDISLEKLLSNEQMIVNFVDDFEKMMTYVTIVNGPEILTTFETVIFENGQGLLLDQNNKKYFPHLTPSNTGLTNPMQILNEIDYKGFITANYVSRTYVTRHGAGLFPGECKKSAINADMFDETNIKNMWQDDLRYGKINGKRFKEHIIEDISNNSSGQIIVKPKLYITHCNEYDYWDVPIFNHIHEEIETLISYGPSRSEGFATPFGHKEIDLDF